MKNDQIADNFSLLAKLMDIHGDNSFKSRSYSNAAYQINQLSVPLSYLTISKINALKGIGDAIGKKIQEQIESGEFSLLKDYLKKTPPGIIEMLSIKGLGPKKISTIWKELEIETLGELLYACNENRLTLYKGFGEKTQKNIREAIEFYLQHQGQFLFAEIDPWAQQLLEQLVVNFPDCITLAAGAWRRQMEIVPYLTLVTSIPAGLLQQQLNNWHFTVISVHEQKMECTSREGIEVHFVFSAPELIYRSQFELSADVEFIEKWNTYVGWPDGAVYQSEEDIFKLVDIHPIPPAQRELGEIIDKAKGGPLPATITAGEIRGIIHCHSQWSDGSDSLEDMAKAARQQGLEYLIISDHSKSAFYANGLSSERVMEQHKEIDRLNEILSPFTIFKSIESDVLSDGSLDYPTDVLAKFDIVIASIHSNLKMPQEKSMQRLLTAVANPFTTILGHPTGRLLLSRSGYPVDHDVLLEACARYQVAIELNAHPRRLDVDWRWIEKARKLGVMISINPDAHNIAGMQDIKYGVLVAQKAGLNALGNLSSYSLPQMREFILLQKKKQGK